MKRYEPAVEHGSPVMEPYSLGDWVRYEDAKLLYDALLSIVNAADSDGWASLNPSLDRARVALIENGCSNEII